MVEVSKVLFLFSFMLAHSFLSARIVRLAFKVVVVVVFVVIVIVVVFVIVAGKGSRFCQFV